MKRLFLMMCGASCVSSALAASMVNCDMPYPPRAAAITADHGFFFYIFPREIDNSYTGCQTMWDEKGKAWLVLTFQQGNLTQYKEKLSDNGKPPLACQYSKEMLTSNSPANCPEYNSVKNGFRSIAKHDEPLIPQGRDPRR